MMMSAGMETKINQPKNWQIIKERPTTRTNGFMGMPKMAAGLVQPLNTGEVRMSAYQELCKPTCSSK